MDAAEFEQIQSRMQDSLRNLASSSGRIEDATQAVLASLLKGYNRQQPKQSADAAVRTNLPGGLRKLCLDLVLEAQQRGQPPMQFVARGASDPVLQRLLAAVLYCCQQELLDPCVLMQLLDDVQEASIIEHCLDIITWLEGNMAVLAAPPFSSNGNALNQVTRLCNSILKRLGKHQVMNKARLLMLIASVTPLLDRSGLGIPGAFAVADPPAAEPVPDGAVDSTGKPVDTLVYSTFWGLQRLLQDPHGLLSSPDSWSAFKKNLALVLAELAKSPATVPAVRPAPAAASGPDAVPAEADAAAAQEGEGTQCYLSSWKLFGLQLTDSAFRRDFLVQVLVVLRTLLIQGKVPATSLKPKERMEALGLEKEVYKVLEATPRNGKEFARGVREVLERETTWVGWKKGGKDFVVPGKEAPARRGQQPPAVCIDWSKPPLSPPLTEVVSKAKAEAAARVAAVAARHEEGRGLKREVDAAGRVYDTRGEPIEDPRAKRARYTKLLDGGSNVTLWAQERLADRSLQSQPLLTGLKLSEQPQFPLPEALCAQVIRELEPDADIDKQYRRLTEDSLYRWRVQRLVTQAQRDVPSGTTSQLEWAMVTLHPDKLSPEARKLLEAEIAEDAAKKKKAAEAAKRSALAGRRTPPPGSAAAKKAGGGGAAASPAKPGAAAGAAKRPAGTPTASGGAGASTGAVAAGGAGEEVGQALDAEMQRQEEGGAAAAAGRKPKAAAAGSGAKPEDGDGEGDAAAGSDEGELAGLAAAEAGEENEAAVGGKRQQPQQDDDEEEDAGLAGLEAAAANDDEQNGAAAGMEVDG